MTIKTPPTKPVRKPAQQLIELPEDSGAIFQAIGIVPGEVNLEKPASVTVEGKQYPLFYTPERKGVFDALQKNIDACGSSQRLIVYPRVKHLPGRENNYQIAFTAIGFIGREPRATCLSKELNDFEFHLSGLWQQIPVCSIPCITVQKNYSKERLDFIKQTDVSTKVQVLKASHIPVNWSNPPVKPFRFNPRLDKELQGRAPFVQVTAKFTPDRDVFDFVSLRSLPASNSPKCLKAGKQDKADALSIYREKGVAK